MQSDNPVSDEIDINEVIRITGKTRDTIMRWKRAGRITGRTESITQVQRQRRLLFRRSEIEKITGAES